MLEALGVRIDLAPDAVARCIDEVGFGFMFAPAHHGATRFVVPVRKELAVRTIFNFLGPLTNPAGAAPPAHRRLRPRVPGHDRGGAGRAWARRKALVVSSDDGLDEMSTSGPTRVVEVDGDAIERYDVAPEDVGLAARHPAPSPAARPTTTPTTTRAILAGEPGPGRDLALLNAGAAIYVAGRADSLREGVRAAREAVDAGAPRRRRGAASS